jgi:TonB-dependent receptor
VQEQENFDFETINLAGTIEARPTENLRFYVDGIYNDQERAQDSYRIQASGVSSLRQLSIPTSFETVDFGVGPGEFPAALTGTLEPDLANDDDDPNLRFSSDTGARVTDTRLISIGGEWEKGDFTARAEVSSSTSETVNPNLSSTLNFINPACPLDGTSNDNCVPFIYDLSNDTLSFGINFDSPFAPEVADLTNPNNVVLDDFQVGRSTTDNEDNAFRIDLSYDVSEFAPFITSFDAGFRHNSASSEFDDLTDRVGGFSRIVDSPNGSLFADILVEGPDNFDAADGRDLFVSDFLLVDPDLAFSDPQRVIDTLQAAVIAHDPTPDILNVQSDQNAFFRVEEDTTAIYAQANFEHGIVKGNVGARWVQTDIESTAFSPDLGGPRELVTTRGSYDFLLPRANISITPREDIVLRAAYSQDILRPDFNQLTTGFSFNDSENSAVRLGNPGLEPEDFESFDVSAAWYFAPSSVISVGYFNKKRTNIFGTDFEGAEIINGPTPEGFVTTGGFARDTNPACSGGGIFNPVVVPNQLGDPDRLGLCVDTTMPGNDPETTTQVAFQTDLSAFEDTIGFASGFGVIANYTYQDFSGGSAVDTTSGRGLNVLGDVSIPRGLLDFSPNAYNLTGFYEKYGLSARVRYTWREAFRTQDFGGGANTSGSSTFSFPVTTLSRGQLNASINYDVTENFNIGVEAVNLTEARIIQRCVSETGPTCFVGYPDRRIIFGGSYTF